METAVFKRNVLRTLSAKTAKAGLRTIARKTPSVFVLQAIIGLNTEFGRLKNALHPYMLGHQLTDGIRTDAKSSAGGVYYYTVLLARTLKTKIPGSGKKVHLKDMTMTEGLLKLDTLTGDLMYSAAGVFSGEDLDLDDIKATCDSIIALLWPLTYDLIGTTPAEVFEEYMAGLSNVFPTGLFSSDDAEYKAALAQLKADEVGTTQVVDDGSMVAAAETTAA